MKKLRQYHIAQLAGITPGFFSAILQGRKRPSWAKAKALAKATGTEPAIWMDTPPDKLRVFVRDLLA